MNFSDSLAKQIFYDHAFPCLYQKYTRKEISRQKFRELRQDYRIGKIPDDTELHRLFPTAFLALEEIAKEKGKQNLDRDVVEYFWSSDSSGGHNSFISQRKGVYCMLPDSKNKECMVHLAKVIKKAGKLRAIVEYDNKKEKVSTFEIPDIKVGDETKIHLFYAIKKRQN